MATSIIRAAEWKTKGMRVSLVVLLAVAAAAGGYAVAQSYRLDPATAAKVEASRARTTTSNPGEQVRPSDDSRELAELRREVRRLGAEVGALRSQASPTQEPAPVDPTDPAAVAAQREERRAYLADVEAQFVNEPRDARWSSATHNAITEAFNASGLRDAAANIECRSNTCRVEIADKGPDTIRLLVRAVTALGQTLPAVEWNHLDDGNGRRSKVLYMSRPDGS